MWGTYAVGDDVGVAVEGSLGVSVARLVAGEVPDDKRLVTAAREEHVGAIVPSVPLYPTCPFETHFSNDVAKLVTHPVWPRHC
jgi:hypothetical protein